MAGSLLYGMMRHSLSPWDLPNPLKIVKLVTFCVAAPAPRRRPRGRRDSQHEEAQEVARLDQEIQNLTAKPDRHTERAEQPADLAADCDQLDLFAAS
jgi:hypothetical protein